MVRRRAPANWHPMSPASMLCGRCLVILAFLMRCLGTLRAGDSESMVSTHSQISLVSKTEFADNFQGLNSEEVEAAVHQVRSCLPQRSLGCEEGCAG